MTPTTTTRMLFTTPPRLLFSLLGCLLISNALPATPPPASFTNPILPGFFPDPSICRVGDTFYLVNSSFEWFPGVPVHRSRDLVNWELIGHALDRPSQLAMPAGMKASRGIWAPTLRFHDGLFYMVTTAQDCGGNFFVTARDPAGPWSEPIWIKGAPGIDPTIFWDDDGSSWYLGAGWVQGGQRWPNENRIYLQRIDLATGELLGDRHTLTSGHAANARWTEGPHLYKHHGKYVLLVAEGGTGSHHAVTIHHADTITGPYVPDHANPVLTHRHQGLDAPVTSIGHADLVETPSGDWWSVMLGVRPSQRINLLGRETFLTPVSWIGSTLVFNPGEGRVRLTEHRPALPWTPVPTPPARDDFDGAELRRSWNFLRTPAVQWWDLKSTPGFLSLPLRPESVTEKVNPSLVARRIQHFRFDATTRVVFHPTSSSEVAGLVVLQSDGFHYRLILGRTEKGTEIRLVRRERGQDTLVATQPWKTEHAVLRLSARDLAYTFLVGSTEADLVSLGPPQDAAVCSTTRAGGFTGPYVGMYASAEGTRSASAALFDWFDYVPCD